MRTLLRLLFIVTLAIILLVGWLYLHIHSKITLPYVPYELSIRPGSSLKHVAQKLAQDDVLITKWSLIVLARYLNRDAEIKAGDYQLTENITQIALLEYLTKGDAKHNEITFIEGWTFSQLRKILNEHPAIVNTTANLNDQELLQLIGAEETATEGLFFPDTYYFIKGDSDIDILRRAYHAMRNHLQANWALRTESLPLATPYEALILASIIEKETAIESDRALIAGVFVNRLRKGMRLQTDPTIIYGLGEQFDGNLRKKDLLADQAYNTYTRAGLPPTPIALPSLASIRAALNPAKTDALYFVAKGNGESEFSNNLTDHNEAVSKYQKQQK